MRQRGVIDHLAGQPATSRALQRVLDSVERQSGRPQLVAHRIVHGGDVFWKPTKLSSGVIQRLQRLAVLAPLHLPINLRAVQLVRRRWPSVEQWGVFDTGLYHALPEPARLYSIPLSLARRYHIRKYGFHGISHAATFARACRRLGWSPRRVSGVTIHLGAGDSITAWQRGRPVDTSMGFTPLEGLTMATRSGDLDPFIPLYLQTRLGWSPTRVSRLLEQRSGLFGISGLRDIRDVLAAAGHPVRGWPRRVWKPTQRRHARLALRMFIYDIQRYLASYLGMLPQPRLIAFTGAVGNNPWIRQQVLRGVPIVRGLRVVSRPADEEGAIADAVRNVVS